MIEKVRRVIEKYNMISSGDKVVVGVSGGPDSIALLHILRTLKIDLNFEIIVAHVNHNLRGNESDMDQKYVEDICNEWNFKYFCKSVDIENVSKSQGISYELAGREARYKFFHEILNNEGAQRVAVAHNADDNAETILMRLIRGTGLEGLCGIKPVRDAIIRPLIEISRDEIESYCKTNNLNPRIDSSNLENIYTRNKIRLDLIPYIKKEFNPNIIGTLNRMQELISQDNKYIDMQVDRVCDEILIEKSKEYIRLNLDKIDKQDNLILGRVLRKFIKEFLGNISDFEQKNIQDIINFIKDSKTGSTYDLPKGLKIKKSYNELFITKNIINDVMTYSYDINIPGITKVLETGDVIEAEIYDVSNVNITSSQYVQRLDYDKIKGKILIRTRNKNDFFSPLGMKGKKKLKDFYIDEKIPRNFRDNIPLVAYESEIIWIIGKRISDNYKVDTNTKKVLVLTYKKA